MSYISALRSKDEVYVWERIGNKRKLVIYPAPYYFYYKSPKGTYTSIYGDKLARYDCADYSEFFALKKQQREKDDEEKIELFESDIPPEIKVLSEHYYGKPAPNLHVTFLDIEVDYMKSTGFASTKNPYAPINSVALYHKWLNKYCVIAVPPEQYQGDEAQLKSDMEAVHPLPDNTDLEIVLVHNERSLLRHFLEQIEDSDVLSGWNSKYFDIPYIGKRLERLKRTEMYLQKLSFPEAPPPRFVEERRMQYFSAEKVQTLQMYGRITTDYLELFKKYEVAERPSYKLESIADEVLPDLPKLTYEGSLSDLYRNNFPWFVRYNIRDTEILHGFEDRLGYVALANEMCHLSTAQFDHVTGTLKLSEYATINYCHHVLGGLIVNDSRAEYDEKPQPGVIDDDDDDEPAIQGAYVLEPKTGMHEWIGSIDINSLYPSSIRAINISPETLRGQFVGDETCGMIAASDAIARGDDTILYLQFEDGTVEEKPAHEWREILEQRKWSVSGYGTVFDQNKLGIIPKILSDWYDKRKEFQKAKKDSERCAAEILEKYSNKPEEVEVHATTSPDLQQHGSQNFGNLNKN